MAATKVGRLRFTFSPFTSEQMLDLGNTVLASIKDRIDKGITVQGQQAKALQSVVPIVDGKRFDTQFIPYVEQKRRKGLQTIRDLKKTGGLMSSIQVTSVNQNRAVISSNNPIKDRILHKNQRLSPEFGMSESDTAVMQKKVREMLEKAFKISSI